jgi:hypothetical protein
MRSTTLLLCQTRPSPKAIESARMALEMALKALLCLDPDVTPEVVKQRYSHNLTRLLDDALKTPAGVGLGPVKGLLVAFPAVGARYDGEEYPSVRLWAAYQAAQFACTAVVRSITGRDIRNSLQISWPTVPPSGS